MKKKFFVLRSTSNNGPARLEYYDNEKKFNAGNPAKRTLELYKCFNINKNCDTKHKHVIALYIKDHCFSVIAEDVADQESWMNLMLEYQNDFTPSCKQHYGQCFNILLSFENLGHWPPGERYFHVSSLLYVNVLRSPENIHLSCLKLTSGSNAMEAHALV